MDAAYYISLFFLVIFAAGMISAIVTILYNIHRDPHAKNDVASSRVLRTDNGGDAGRERQCSGCGHMLPIEYFEDGDDPNKCYLCDTSITSNYKSP